MLKWRSGSLNTTAIRSGELAVPSSTAARTSSAMRCASASCPSPSENLTALTGELGGGENRPLASASSVSSVSNAPEGTCVRSAGPMRSMSASAAIVAAEPGSYVTVTTTLPRAAVLSDQGLLRQAEVGEPVQHKSVPDRVCAQASGSPRRAPPTR